MLSIENAQAIGEVFNICDDRLVTREEFIGSIADYLDQPRPGHVPYWLARGAVTVFECFARCTGRKTAPILTRTRMKFMTLNLDFSTAKAERILGYQPQVDFQDGIREALDWLAEHDRLPGRQQKKPPTEAEVC